MSSPIVRCMSTVVQGTPANGFADSDVAWFDFITICNGIDGLTVLTSSRFDFPGGGVSGTIIIAESHAAIHTWPEFNQAWVELATCGRVEALDEFCKRVATRWQVIGDWQRTVPSPR
jgi:S-adenosylmethionine/arginine decarboxylase-like enzyme